MQSDLLADVIGTLKTQGTIGSGQPVDVIAKIISTAIGLLTVIAGIYFIFNIITAAIGIVTAGGDKGNLETARTKMTHSLIGLIVTISAMFIVGLLTTVLGFPDILDFGGMISSLGG
jgi:hypothetical protein